MLPSYTRLRRSATSDASHKAPVPAAICSEPSLPAPPPRFQKSKQPRELQFSPRPGNKNMPTLHSPLIYGSIFTCEKRAQSTTIPTNGTPFPNTSDDCFRNTMPFSAINAISTKIRRVRRYQTFSPRSVQPRPESTFGRYPLSFPPTPTLSTVHRLYHRSDKLRIHSNTSSPIPPTQWIALLNLRLPFAISSRPIGPHPRPFRTTAAFSHVTLRSHTRVSNSRHKFFIFLIANHDFFFTRLLYYATDLL